jgi:hypothetical protein
VTDGGPDVTRRIPWYDDAEAAGTTESRRRYPPLEDLELSRLDRMDRDRASAPRPIRDPVAASYWVRVGLLVGAAVVLGLLIGWFGVPAVPR